jgi:hypothetical protein
MTIGLAAERSPQSACRAVVQRLVAELPPLLLADAHARTVGTSGHARRSIEEEWQRVRITLEAGTRLALCTDRAPDRVGDGGEDRLQRTLALLSAADHRVFVRLPRRVDARLSAPRLRGTRPTRDVSSLEQAGGVDNSPREVRRNVREPVDAGLRPRRLEPATARPRTGWSLVRNDGREPSGSAGGVQILQLVRTPPQRTCIAETALCRYFRSGRQDLNLRPPGPQPE